jgi:hypothetical protein
MAAAGKRGWKPDHPTFAEPEFEPYALAIGRLALAWNDLHERLAHLFWILMGAGFADRPIALWNSANFDRPRREMLKAAAGAASPRELEQFPRMADDIKWLCDRTEDFENIRNDAVHSPLFLAGSWTPFGIPATRVFPNDLLQNTRAARLIGKDLLAEFSWCYSSVIVLRDFAAFLDRALTAEGAAWPDRLALPARPHHNPRPSAPRTPKAHRKE